MACWLGVASRWWWKSGRAWLQVGMLCGGRDGLGVGLVGGWVEKVTAEVLEQPGRGRGGGQPAPAAARAVQDGPDELEARPLAGEPPDDLGPAAGLPEGPLEQVGVADALPVLAGEAQMRGELAQRRGEACDRSRLGALVPGGECLGPVGDLIDRGLPGRLVDVIEDGPVRSLDLGLRGDWDLGEHVAGTMDQTTLAQRGRERLLDGTDEPGGAIADHQHG